MLRPGGEASVLRFRLLGEADTSFFRAKAFGHFADGDPLVFRRVPPWLRSFRSLEPVGRVGDRDGELRRFGLRRDFESRRGARPDAVHLSRLDLSCLAVPVEKVSRYKMFRFLTENYRQLIKTCDRARTNICVL